MDPEVYPYDDYTCRLVRLPGDVHALIAETEDGWPLIWINDALPPQARTKAFWPPRAYSPSGMPAASIASVIATAARGPLQRISRRTMSACR